MFCIEPTFNAMLPVLVKVIAFAALEFPIC